MANTRANQDAYIIFGVEDETFQIIGVENNSPRRTQQQLVDILRGVPYVGSVRPRIELKAIRLEQHDIDVLIVKNSFNVPYYLEKDYKDTKYDPNEWKEAGKIVKAFHIYTRVVDNNTAIDKNADLNDVEYLWRMRFGIDLAVKDRFMVLLHDWEKWEIDWATKNYSYHSDYPEFQLVRQDEMKQGWMPSAAFYTHPVMHIAKLNLMYHNTIIYETELWSFDEYRKYLPKAQTCRVPNHGNTRYSFYLLDTIEGLLLKLFTHGTLDISSREPDFHQLLIFQSKEEQADYNHYVMEHFSDYSDDEIQKTYEYQIAEDNKDNGGGIIYSAFQVAKCARIYEDWKELLLLSNAFDVPE